MPGAAPTAAKWRRARTALAAHLRQQTTRKPRSAASPLASSDAPSGPTPSVLALHHQTDLGGALRFTSSTAPCATSSAAARQRSRPRPSARCTPARADPDGPPARRDAPLRSATSSSPSKLPLPARAPLHADRYEPRGRDEDLQPRFTDGVRTVPSASRPKSRIGSVLAPTVVAAIRAVTAMRGCQTSEPSLVGRIIRRRRGCWVDFRNSTRLQLGARLLRAANAAAVRAIGDEVH